MFVCASETINNGQTCLQMLTQDILGHKYITSYAFKVLSASMNDFSPSFVSIPWCDYIIWHYAEHMEALLWNHQEIAGYGEG